MCAVYNIYSNSVLNNLINNTTTGACMPFGRTKLVHSTKHCELKPLLVPDGNLLAHELFLKTEGNMM